MTQVHHDAFAMWAELFHELGDSLDLSANVLRLNARSSAFVWTRDFHSHLPMRAHFFDRLYVFERIFRSGSVFFCGLLRDRLEAPAVRVQKPQHKPFGKIAIGDAVMLNDAHDRLEFGSTSSEVSKRLSGMHVGRYATHVPGGRLVDLLRFQGSFLNELSHERSVGFEFVAVDRA